MTSTEWGESNAEMAEGYAHQAYLMEKQVKPQPKMLAPEILDWEIRDEDWEWMRLDNEPGYSESLFPWRH